MNPTLELEQIEKFSFGVENIAAQGNTYIDSILSYCDTNDIEIELIPKLISPALLSRLQKEARDFHLIKKSNIKKLR